MKSVKYILIIFTLTSLFGQCSFNEEPEKIANTPVIPIQQIFPPFHFQKGIEVKPGLTLDILSWGRGSDSTGAYLILRSDSTHKKYSSSTGELNGNIIDVWDMDMDSDGNPEIFIHAKDKKGYLTLFVHEFEASGTSQKIHFPDLSDATKAKYRGKDSIYIKDGKLTREFPLFKQADPDNKPSDGKKVVVYTLARNNFSVGELDPKTMKPISPPAPKKVVAKKRVVRRRR